MSATSPADGNVYEWTTLFTTLGPLMCTAEVIGFIRSLVQAPRFTPFTALDFDLLSR
ncbi:hypothetical protein B0H19DRAFT_1263542 [Mycena capillaripes]|nr:hypothetical protein B0H19DRAFT_1263542 [Mycena capillaripes]